MAMKRPQIESLWPLERLSWGLDPAGEGFWSFTFDHELAPPGTRIEVTADGDIELIGPLAGCWWAIPAANILSSPERPGFDQVALRTHLANAHILTLSRKISEWYEFSATGCSAELAESLQGLPDEEEGR